MWQRYEFNLRNSLVLSFLVYGKSESCLLALSFHLQDLLPQALSQEYLLLPLSLRRGQGLGLQHHFLVSCRNIKSYALLVLSNSKIYYFLCKIVIIFVQNSDKNCVQRFGMSVQRLWMYIRKL